MDTRIIGPDGEPIQLEQTDVVAIVVYDPETRQYTAHDRLTGVASCGDTPGEAFDNLCDAVDVLHATLAEDAAD